MENKKLLDSRVLATWKIMKKVSNVSDGWLDRISVRGGTSEDVEDIIGSDQTAQYVGHHLLAAKPQSYVCTLYLIQQFFAKPSVLLFYWTHNLC